MTIELLSDLTENELKEMCPQISTRIKVRQKIEAMRAENRDAPADINSNGNVPDLNLEESDHELNDLLLFNNFVDLNLKDLLDKAPEGNEIYTDLNATGKLSSKSQQCLVDVIGRHLYPWLKVKTNFMKRERYYIILRNIKEEFPNELSGVYYTPPVSNKISPTHKSIGPRGKLPDKVRNLLHQSEIRKKRKNDEALEQQQQDKILEDLQALHNNSINWLKNNRNPWESVVAKWTETFEVRKNSKYQTLREFIDDWSIMNDLRSKHLVSVDFELLYPGKGFNLSLNWPTFFDRVRVFHSKKYLNDKALKTWKDQLNKLENSENVTADMKFPLQMNILAYLIPPKGRRSRKFKYSIQESLDNIFIIVENPGDIEKRMQDQINCAYAKEDRVQPYIIIQGSFTEHNQILLVMDDIKYQFSSAMKAFDCLFKIYHTLNACYPKGALHLHLLIQRCVYKIKNNEILPLNILDTVTTLEII
ncbi:uncharacterized protein LOC103578083 isoform X2 [Microplitis demolitor]|uniref:uncharacterized protein LOC103578083 isoform X2 n=1 Tax=Microplitis demolitor TaxID=69319 RepID=UPI00235B6EC7|nr:uncharacterized protein LOC103578083 isoform X2 [Microplitis demolitor]